MIQMQNKIIQMVKANSDKNKGKRDEEGDDHALMKIKSKLHANKWTITQRPEILHLKS